MAINTSLLQKLVEARKQLVLKPLRFKPNDLSPAMSPETIDYHYNQLAKAYVDRFNRGEGDPSFNEAAAFLHNMWFEQFEKYTNSSLVVPSGKTLTLIVQKYGSFQKFKEQFFKVAMGIQGSGWVYLAKDGEIKTIPNHSVTNRNEILFLVDWWEHAWALDYQSDKKAYMDNLWRIVDWNVIEDRING